MDAAFLAAQGGSAACDQRWDCAYFTFRCKHCEYRSFFQNSLRPDDLKSQLTMSISFASEEELPDVTPQFRSERHGSARNAVRSVASGKPLGLGLSAGTPVC